MNWMKCIDRNNWDIDRNNDYLQFFIEFCNMKIFINSLRELIKWIGSKKSIEYKLNVPIENIDEWIHKNIRGGE